MTVTAMSAARGGARGFLGRLDASTFVSAALFVAFFGGWELAVREGVMPAFVLPSPSAVLVQVLADLTSANTLYNCAYTLTEILVGFFGALVLGVGLGALIALSPMVDKVLSPYIVALQTIPKVAVAPILVIWFGFGIESKIVIVALIDFFPILVNAVAGFRSTDPRQILLMKSLEASDWQIFLKVRLPNATPFLMAGVYISMIFSVIGAVVGEFIGSAHGLGSLIVQRQAGMDVVGVFSVLVILTLIGMCLNFAARFVGKRLAFWSNTESSSGI